MIISLHTALWIRHDDHQHEYGRLHTAHTLLTSIEHYSPGLNSHIISHTNIFSHCHRHHVEHNPSPLWDQTTLWDLHGKIPASNPAVSIPHTHCQPLKIYSIYSS